MPPYRSHYEFAFTDQQRTIMRVIAALVRDGLEAQRRRSLEAAADGQPERLPLAPLDELLAEVAKFAYNLDEPSVAKVSLSARLLILFLFELMQKIGNNPGEKGGQLPATVDEYLRLHYFLSYELMYFHTMHDYHSASAEQDPAQRPVVANTQDYLNTAGMDKVAVFTALYNAAGLPGEPAISLEEGEKLYNAAPKRTHYDDQDEEDEQPHESYFDYVGSGRPMKISRLEIENGLIDVATYNSENYHGPGTAQRAVEHLPRA